MTTPSFTYTESYSPSPVETIADAMLFSIRNACPATISLRNRRDLPKWERSILRAEGSHSTRVSPDEIRFSGPLDPKNPETFWTISLRSDLIAKN